MMNLNSINNIQCPECNGHKAVISTSDVLNGYITVSCMSCNQSMTIFPDEQMNQTIEQLRQKAIESWTELQLVKEKYTGSEVDQ